MQTFDGNLYQPFNKAISYWNPWKTKVFAQYTVFDQYRFTPRRKVRSQHNVRSHKAEGSLSTQCSLQGERFAHNTMFAPTRRKVRTVHSVRSKAEGSLTTQCSLPQGGRFAQYTVFARKVRSQHNVRSVHSVRSKAEGSLSTQCSHQAGRDKSAVR